MLQQNGALTGTGQLLIGTLLLPTGAEHYLGLANLVVEHQASWTGARIAMGGTAARLTINPGARFDIQLDGVWDGYGTAGIVNFGTLAKSGGSGDAWLYPGLQNFGTVEATSGRLVLLGTGQHGAGSLLTTHENAWIVLNGGSRFEAGAQLRGNLRLASDSSMVTLMPGSDAQWHQLALSGGRLALADGLVARADAPLDNRGRVDVEAGTLRLSSGSMLRAGSLLSTGSTAAWAELGAGIHLAEAGARLEGNLRLSNGGGSYGSLQLAQGASMQAQQLELLGSAVLTLDAGAQAQATTLLAHGRWLNGAGQLLVTQRATVLGGGIDGTVTLRSQGELLITGSDTKQWWGGEIRNQGSAMWDGGSIESGLRFINEPGARFEIRGDRAWAWGSSGDIVNLGWLGKTSGSSDNHTYLQPKLDNQGTLEVAAGVLWLGSSFDNQGLATVAAGARLQVGGDLYFDNHGTLAGNGTMVQQGHAPIRNNGLISPGASVGHLTLDGDLSFSHDSALRIELDGSGADWLTVLGRVQLGGTVEVVNLGYQPVLGQRFRIVDFAGLDGAARFEQLAASGFGAEVGFRLLYADDGIDLQVSAVPEPGPVALWAAGLGVLGLLVRRRTAA